MHVLILLAQQHWTGAAEPVLQIARGLADRGHRVTFVYTRVPPGHLADHVDPEVLDVLPEVKLVRKGFAPLAMFNDWRRLRRFVRTEKVDVIFCHQTHDHAMAVLALGRLVRRPLLVRQIHESRQLGRRRGYQWLFGRTDMLVVAVARWKQKILSEYGLDPSRVYVLPPAVDTRLFHPDQPTQKIRDEIGAAAGERLIGIVGRIKPGRGQDLALDAFGLVLKKAPDARLLVVGRGEGKDALEAAARQRPYARRVHFLGYRTDDLAAIYAACDITLLLGEGSDGSCRAALEAMACGTPVVALPVGTLPESIRDGETGLFVQPDPDDLAAGIVEILEAPFLGDRARGHAERTLSLDLRVERLESVFEEMAELR